MIGRFFGPVMVTWFVVIGGLGAVNIWGEPGVVRALNPLEAARFLSANPLISFAVFGAVFLTLTGGEALYADMGHVGAAAIRRAWFALVLPALLLNYFGQGALVLPDPTAIENPFYRLAPPWALVPMVVLAAMATIIASQALISGIFSLTRQAIQMGFCPLAKIVPTSSEEAGQIYVSQLAVDGRHLVDCRIVQDVCQPRGRLWHRRVGHHVDNDDLALSGDGYVVAACHRRADHRGLRRRRRGFPCFQFLENRSWRMDSNRDRRFGSDRDAELASRLVGGAASVVRYVDAACQVRRQHRRDGRGSCRGDGSMANESCSRRVADAASSHQAQSGHA